MNADAIPANPVGSILSKVDRILLAQPIPPLASLIEPQLLTISPIPNRSNLFTSKPFPALSFELATLFKSLSPTSPQTVFTSSSVIDDAIFDFTFSIAFFFHFI